ncbi:MULTISPECIES: hypothetical protein [unclassified Bradyrhizobium]|uniref:hypothetical protein n=1 Tax=unclassified Bradyrhizobium TaxID=2631580 RepID=UPI0028F069D3|nr:MULTISPECIES: hypothetical protein [unclassified Bradyrhizobium]
MSTLTRRRDPQARDESWRILFGEIEAGTISRRTGNPSGTPEWHWFCGFYPGSPPGEQTVGTASTFDQARQAFEAAWTDFVSRRSPADFETWRRHHAFTAWKYAMWDAGCRMPAQNSTGRSRCFCGATIELGTTEAHIYAHHMQALRA